MKAILFLILILQGTVSTAQYKFKPVFIDACTQEINQIWFFSLNDSITYSSKLILKNGLPIDSLVLPEEGYINISKPGIYSMTIGDFSYSKHVFEIKDDTISIQCDSIFTGDIELLLVVSNPPTSVYHDCMGIRFNGKVLLYHPNGKPKFKGTFIDGHPTDSLITYYSNGQIWSLSIYREKGTIHYEYDFYGNLVSLDNLRRRQFITYYANGQTQTCKKYRKYLCKGKFSTKHYYSNGGINLKGRDTYWGEIWKSYHQNGDRIQKISGSSSTNSSTHRDSLIVKTPFTVKLYRDNKLVYKIHWELDRQNKEFIHFYVCYEKIGNKWMPIEKIEEAKVSEYVLELKRKLNS